ncbi:hypothetical protein [Oryza sativa Japonica Group]|uniref:Os01g0501900 protein n=2 Tax=Oryza sativa subsp. japonica TaxID=39947 RepID=Q5QN09_ORYSJ|nr:hypothetical protein OsJ_01922 [Oryza sativa Japonica Group]BAD73182.1 hypothetical protein [Oryza sativa Japonica Group]BAD73253.1 hypothetical protein [Oryza sativa Japonica Group]BAS72323.1 Os01g0501900 [Oryza sativa Japonica Group]
MELAVRTSRGHSIQIWWPLVVRGLTPNHGVAAAPDLPLRSLWAPDPRGPVAGERRGGVSGGEGGGGYDKKRRKASPRQVSGGEDGCAATKMAMSRVEAKRANEEE